MIKYFLLSLLMAVGQMAGSPSRTGATAATAGGGGHSFTVIQTVQGTNCQGDPTTTLTCTLSATAAGNQLLVSCEGAGSTLSTTPSSTALLTMYNGAYGYTSLYLAQTVTTGTTSIVINDGAYNKLGCVVAEVNGVATSSPIDATHAFAAGAYGTSVSTGSATTTNAADVIFGVVDGGPLGTCTAGTGYTLLGSATYSTTYQTCIEYKVLTVTGANNPAMSWTTGGSSTVGTAAIKLQ